MRGLIDTNRIFKEDTLMLRDEGHTNSGGASKTVATKYFKVLLSFNSGISKTIKKSRE